MIIFGFILPIVAFFFESYPRILNRKFGVDIWTHLLYLREYHKQKGIPKKIENGFLVKGRYDYPPIFISILSKFPIYWVEKYEFVFSPFFDALHVLLIYFLVFQMTESIQIALITQVLYILTPIIILENSSATPRSLGYLLFTIVFMSIFTYFNQGGIFYLIIAIFFGSLIFLSHRFTTQGFLFMSIFFSILDRNLIYLITFVLSFCLAVFISDGFYLTVLKGHIGNLQFWYKNIRYRFMHQVYGDIRNNSSTDIIFKIYNQFLKFPPFVLSITNPWTLPVLYYAFYYYSSSPSYAHLVWWVLFTYILALSTTWIPTLRFLGEGQRYLELSAFPSAFISALILFQAINASDKFFVLLIYAIFIIGAFLTIVIIQRKAIIKESLRTLTPDMEKMFEYLKSLEKKPKLLCIPHQITTNTIYHTDCPVFVNAEYATIEKISDVYPFIKKPIELIMKENKLDMILLNEAYAKIEDLRLKKYKVVKKIGKFFLIKTHH